MNIYKRGKVWYLDARSEGGGQTSLGVSSKKIAEQILAQKRLDALEGKLDMTFQTDKKIITLSEAFDNFFVSAKNRVKPQTLRRYKVSEKNILKHFRKDLDIRKITSSDVESFKNLRMKEGLRPASVNRDIELLRNMYNRMKRLDMVKISPIDNVDIMFEDNIVLRVLSREEFNRLLSECHLDYLAMGVKLAMFTGMRKGEILSLRMPEKNIFKFMRKAQIEKLNWVHLRNKMVVLNETKNNKPRNVPLAGDIFNELSEYTKNIQPGERIFPVNDFRRAWELARSRADLDDIDFHYLRKTFISNMASMGYSREIVQSIVGQISEEVFKRYCKISEIAKFNAVEKIVTNLLHSDEVIKFNKRESNS